MVAEREANSAGGDLSLEQELRLIKAERDEALAREAATAAENARLLTELRESLDCQIATTEVLGVISASPGELAPVFNTILDSALRLCDADTGNLYQLADDGLHIAAVRGALPTWEDQLRQRPAWHPRPDMPFDYAIRQKRPLTIHDWRETPGYTQGYPITVSAVDTGGVRSGLIVPMIRGEMVIGLISIYRREVRPFKSNHADVVGNFADQAVIAIENARLLTELRESLDRQTATSDVLSVISASPGELQPVFDAMVANAVRLCDAAEGALFSGQGMQRVASRGMVPELAAHAELPRGTGSPYDEMFATKAPVHTHDLKRWLDEKTQSAAGTDPPTLHASARIAIERGGVRTVLWVPLLKDGEVIGAFVLNRREVRPFADKQIALIENFAAQAVIAIENARLLTELKESLDRQTATSQVLSVISSSPGELQPVFEAILDNALRLSETDIGHLYRLDADGPRLASLRGAPRAYAEVLRRPEPFRLAPEAAQAIERNEPVQVPDLRSTSAYSQHVSRVVAAVELGGARTTLYVPMIREHEPVGIIIAQRRDVRPFTEKQVELVQNFAAQAVIAIENARLLSELRESLDRQTATSEVLSVISASPGELAPVFDAMLANAIRICGAAFGQLALPRGDGNAGLTIVAVQGAPPALAEILRVGTLMLAPPALAPQQPYAGETLHVLDASEDPSYKVERNPLRVALVELGGARTILVVPLIREGESIGTFHLYRDEVRAFGDKQIELAENFAKQAVIAIENARLLSELRASLDRQTATAEVLRVISSSPGEVAPVFQSTLSNALRLCEADTGGIFQMENGALRPVAGIGVPEGYVQSLPDRMRRSTHETPVAEAARKKGTAHITEIMDTPAYRARDPVAVGLVEELGVHAVLAVPMIREDEVVGAIAINRKDRRPFTTEQVALVENFAKQAVIAIENARLLTELRGSLDRQTATNAVLRVIAESTADAQPVMQAIVEHAARLLETNGNFIYTMVDGRLRVAAMHNANRDTLRNQGLEGLTLDRDTANGRAFLDCRQIHIADVGAALDEFPALRQAYAIRPWGTTLATPLLHDGKSIGVITATRLTVRPFAPVELELYASFAAQAVIAIENARLLAELRESLDRQTATSEVLGVISSSPGELKPVFDAMVENAMRLCEAEEGRLFRLVDDAIVCVASHGPGALTPGTAMPIFPGTELGKVFAEKKTRHFPDYAAHHAEAVRVQPERIVEPVLIQGRLAIERGVRAILCVPLIRDDEAIGVFLLNRHEVRPFTEKQIELVENFAKQAVIAIENARLLTELRESLDRQTATADILRVIASTPGDPKRALDTIAETAARMFDASSVGIRRIADNVLRQIAAAGAFSTTMRDTLPEYSLASLDETGPYLHAAIAEKRQVHIDDFAARQPNAPAVRVARRTGVHTSVFTPLMRQDNAIGVMIVSRTEVRPFQPDELELMRGFADQAVIAIENARLLTELRESLDRQTATAEVLGVISSSPGELKPVFAAMLESAVRLCEASKGAILMLEDGAASFMALQGVGTPMTEQRQRAPMRFHPGSPPDRMVKTKATVQVEDLAAYAADHPDDSGARESVVEGARVGLYVPMLRQGEAVGGLILLREESRPFADKQIALVESFARQAVIAIENARLLSELRESLDRQTATSEVLGVISSTPGELEPVFDTMLENAVRLCAAAEGSLFRIEGTSFQRIASRGLLSEVAAQRDPVYLANTPPGRMMRGKKTVHIADLAVELQENPEMGQPARAAFERGGVRSVLWVPMVRDDFVIGAFVLNRREVQPFTDKQIELVENFAAQAVIAIENARLLNELRESLDRQTATAEVLGVISSSPGELQPVFETMVRSAVRICEAAEGSLFRLSGRVLYRLASFGMSEQLSAQRELPIYPGSTVEPMLERKATVQIHDLLADVQDRERADPGATHVLRAQARIAVERSGIRSIMWVPLVKDHEVVGAFLLSRREARPFSDKQVELVENFAAQAVIAIENARLLTELRESLDRQTATADILRVIASTPGDPTRSLDTISETALRMFGASSVNIRRRDGNLLRMISAAGPTGFAMRRALPEIPIDTPFMGQCVTERRQIDVEDLQAVAEGAGSAAGRLSRQMQTRAAAYTPLMREGEAIGGIAIMRSDVLPFRPDELELMRGFADQAVIAIENARLLTELRTRTDELTESLQQQTATSEVLGVISSSPGALEPVFDTILDNALRLCEAETGHVARLVPGGLRLESMRGAPPDFEAYMQQNPIIPIGPDIAGALERKEALLLDDVREGTGYRARHPAAVAAVELGRIRSGLLAPLVCEGAAIGVIVIYRHEPRPFTAKHLALITNFAAQAVIAIENARLLNELRESLDRQTATSEVLGVISSSPGRLEPVFEAILENAMRICGAKFAGLYRYDGQLMTTVASAGLPEDSEWQQFVRQRGAWRPTPETAIGRAILGPQTIHIPDLASFQDYGADGNPTRTAAIRAGMRTLLAVPMLKDSAAIGLVAFFHREVRPFTDKQIELVENFAKQAVIAIENARLLTELHESLDRQTATSEVLGVISSSPADLRPVFQAIAESTTRLCGADMGNATRVENGRDHYMLGECDMPAALRDFFLGSGALPQSDELARLDGLSSAAPTLHIHDLREHPSYLAGHPLRVAIANLGGVRTLLRVKMLKGDELLGYIGVYRIRVEPFTDKQIELVENFAAQAVIAIENARLLTELRESLDRQTATADILRVIASTPDDPTKALDTIAETAARMFDAASVGIRRFEDGRLRSLAAVGPDSVAVRDAAIDRPVDDSNPAGRSLDLTPARRSFLENRQIHIADNRLRDDAAWQAIRGQAQGLVARSSAYTPLTREGRPIGVMIVHRGEARGPFQPDELELMKGFADQAVIAIENARLLAELRQRTDELAQRQSELRVTFDNMGDGVAMFDGDQRLVSWNRNLQQILDIPDTFFARPHTFRDYITYLIERGEFGPVDLEAELKRYADIGTAERRIERTRPDGRVLEIRNNPVPGGGFVTIYSDVTERRRAEDQIRMARDAAEHALTELKAAQANLIQAEKMASLGQLTAGIAHEIKNPLNFVNNFAGLSVELLGELKEEAQEALAVLSKDKRTAVDEVVEMLTSNLEKIAEHGKRADGIVRSMLAHSRGGSGERQSVNVNALVEESLNLAYHGARAQDQNFNITLERDLDATIGPIELVPQDITRVFLNLLGNGFYAANKRGKDGNDPSFKPVLKVTTRDVGGDVEIRIRDNGIGIPPDIRDKLFQPFFTTKPTGEGTGLGLSISYEIVTQQHGGTIEVDSRVGEYTEFTIRLLRRFSAAARPNTFAAGTRL